MPATRWPSAWSKPTFFLTGGSETPATLCAQLAAEGFGKLAAAVGENLGTPQQPCTGTAQELAASSFASLSVLLVEPCPGAVPPCPGLPDEAFIRGQSAYDQAGGPRRRAGQSWP